jgi:ABC-type branched-subunit amino acid transport system substrate-binding protein
MTERSAYRQPWRGAFARLFALCLAATLAACATGPRGPVGPPPVKQAPPTGPVAEEARNRVAVLVPTTGSNGPLGRSIANAATMALLDTGGRTIRMTVYNTAGGAAGAAQRAIAEGNRLILGPLLAPDVRAVAPIAHAAGVPVISFSNDVSVSGNGVYVLGYVPAQSIERVVGYARSRGIERFAGLIPAGIYGQRASAAFLRAVNDSGGRVVAMQNYSRDASSISAAVRKLTGVTGKVQIRPDGSVAPGASTAGFDALLIADSGRIALVAAPMLQKTGTRTQLLGTELWNTEPGLSNAPVMSGAWFASVPDSNFRQLVQRYRARFSNATPYRLSSLGYDAVLLAVKIGAHWAPGTPFPRGELADKGGFSGIDGAFRFDVDGIAERMLEVSQIGGGGFETVSPAPRSFGN